MKPWMPFQIQSVQSWEELRRFVSQGFQNIFQALNGKIGFTDNINCQNIFVDLVSGDNKISHSLGKIPIGFIILVKTANVDIWKTTTMQWTDKEIYLTTNGNVSVYISIIGG